MKMTMEQIQTILRWIKMTKETEACCGQCSLHLAEFAESKLAGKSIPESLQCIDDHLQICNECHEEFDALKMALESLG